MENEVKIIRNLHNGSPGEFKGLQKVLGLISVRGDEEEVFFNYGYNKERSKGLHVAQKIIIPNVFSRTCLSLIKTRSKY